MTRNGNRKFRMHAFCSKVCTQVLAQTASIEVQKAQIYPPSGMAIVIPFSVVVVTDHTSL